MMSFDTLIAAGIVAGAAAYLYRSFARTRKSGGCGCDSGGGCCGSHGGTDKSGCCSSRH